jgi:DNA-binding beta-propeller fold protein YncE
MRRGIAVSLTCLTLLSALTGPAAASTGARPASPVPARALPPPHCRTQVATAPKLRGEHPSTLRVHGAPFDVAVAPGGRYGIAADEGDQSINGVAVLRLSRGQPRLVRRFLMGGDASPAGMAISPNGKYLAVTVDNATEVLSLPALLAGRGRILLGTLNDHGIGTIEATFSANGDYLFVSDEYSPALSVFDLAKALRSGFSAPGVAVGKLTLGPAVVGSALSPDGRLLYVTSEGAGPRQYYHGLLQVIDVAKAERDPAASLITAVDAGCQPVRVALSANGSVAWVTARESNALLAFDTARLLTQPRRALVADVRVGSEPVGLLLTGDGNYVLVAESARFIQPRRPQTVSVVSTFAALHHGRALVGTIAAGAFPRQFAFDPATGEVLLANYDSGTIEQFPAPASGLHLRGHN